jgi:hypothetical protein
MNFKAYSWNAVRIGLGLLLLVAAGLKLAGQGVSANPPILAVRGSNYGGGDE